MKKLLKFFGLPQNMRTNFIAFLVFLIPMLVFMFYSWIVGTPSLIALFIVLPVSMAGLYYVVFMGNSSIAVNNRIDKELQEKRNKGQV